MKITTKLINCCLAISLAFCFASCGKSKINNKNYKDPVKIHDFLYSMTHQSSL